MPVNGELGDAVTLRESQTQVNIGPFQPLDAILFGDDFNQSNEGWRLIDDPSNGFAGRGTMESVSAGTQGGPTGDYVYQLNATGGSGVRNEALKRVTMPWANGGKSEFPSTVRFECIFTWDSDPVSGSIEDIRDVRVDFDAQTRDSRLGPAVRYQFYDSSDNEVEQWQANTGTRPSPTFTDIPGGDKVFTFNEPWPEGEGFPHRKSWHYLKFDWDPQNEAYLAGGLQVNDMVLDMGSLSMGAESPRDELYGLLNPIISVTSNNAVQTTFYMDSCMLSAEV